MLALLAISRSRREKPRAPGGRPARWPRRQTGWAPCAAPGRRRRRRPPRRRKPGHGRHGQPGEGARVAPRQPTGLTAYVPKFQHAVMHTVLSAARRAAHRTCMSIAARPSPAGASAPRTRGKAVARPTVIAVMMVMLWRGGRGPMDGLWQAGLEPGRVHCNFVPPGVQSQQN